MALSEHQDRSGHAAATRVRVLVVATLVLGGGVGYLLWPRPAAVPRSPARPRPSPPPHDGRAPRPEAATGRIEVTSPVAGATVSVDGRRLGPAPQQLDASAGPHRVRVDREGYLTLERELHVVPGRTVALEARLESATPRLRVEADVPGAKVFLDRRFVGTTPVELRDVPSGTHRLNVSAEGYELHGEDVLLDAPRDVMVRFKEVRLDETLEVVHRHGVGSCRGRLRATTAGLAYETASRSDSFTASLGELEPLSVDYLKKNLRVKVRGGRTWNFTADRADALLSFQQAVEAARKRMRGGP
jgi:hypothetical protein